MKNTKKCLKCGSGSLLAIKAICSEKNSARQLAGLMEISGSVAGLTLGVRKGKLEMIACSECGYAELYIKNPEEIDIDGVIVRKFQ